MSFIDSIVTFLISLGLGFTLGFFYVMAQITAIDQGRGNWRSGSWNLPVRYGKIQ